MKARKGLLIPRPSFPETPEPGVQITKCKEKAFQDRSQKEEKKKEASVYCPPAFPMAVCRRRRRPSRHEPSDCVSKGKSTPAVDAPPAAYVHCERRGIYRSRRRKRRLRRIEVSGEAVGGARRNGSGRPWSPSSSRTAAAAAALVPAALFGKTSGVFCFHCASCPTCRLSNDNVFYG